MPELPEVETIRRNLNTILPNEIIKDIKVHYRPIINNDDTFEEKLIGQKVVRVEREAKFLKFILNDYCLISHLRMEGKYFMNEQIHPRHTHVEFIFESGNILSYHDTRKFGRFELIPIEISDTYLSDVKKLAKDPEDIDFNHFFKDIKSKSRTIKEILLDQTVIGGIGNIYVNEILFISKIHPAKKGFLIKKEEAKSILDNTIKVLARATELGGSTIDTYESLGTKGEFQQELLVHGKKGEPCRNCDGVVDKFQLNGRGTYLCHKCQKSYVVALTGGIGTGKTTVKNYLKKKRFIVIDADEIVNELYEDETFSYNIGREFNALTNNKLDKTKLSKLIFSNPSEKRALESVIHPLVFDRIRIEKLNYNEHLLFLDIPLLFETEYKEYDKSLLIMTDHKTQVSRIMSRDGLSLEEAELRIKNQMSLLEKSNLADYVIENNGSINELYKSIDKYLKQF